MQDVTNFIRQNPELVKQLAKEYQELKKSNATLDYNQWMRTRLAAAGVYKHPAAPKEAPGPSGKVATTARVSLRRPRAIPAANNLVLTAGARGTSTSSTAGVVMAQMQESVPVSSSQQAFQSHSQQNVAPGAVHYQAMTNAAGMTANSTVSSVPNMTSSLHAAAAERQRLLAISSALAKQHVAMGLVHRTATNQHHSVSSLGHEGSLQQAHDVAIHNSPVLKEVTAQQQQLLKIVQDTQAQLQEQKALLAAALQHKPNNNSVHNHDLAPTYLTAAHDALGSSQPGTYDSGQEPRHPGEMHGTYDTHTTAGGSGYSSGRSSSSAWFIPQTITNNNNDTADRAAGGTGTGRTSLAPDVAQGKLHVVRTCSPDGKMRPSRHHKKQILKAEIKRILMSKNSHSDESTHERSLKGYSDLVYPDQGRSNLQQHHEPGHDNGGYRAGRQRRRWSDNTTDNQRHVNGHGGSATGRDVQAGRHEGAGNASGSTTVRSILRTLAQKLAPRSTEEYQGVAKATSRPSQRLTVQGGHPYLHVPPNAETVKAIEDDVAEVLAKERQERLDRLESTVAQLQAQALRMVHDIPPGAAPVSANNNLNTQHSGPSGALHHTQMLSTSHVEHPQHAALHPDPAAVHDVLPSYQSQSQQQQQEAGWPRTYNADDYADDSLPVDVVVQRMLSQLQDLEEQEAQLRSKWLSGSGSGPGGTPATAATSYAGSRGPQQQHPQPEAFTVQEGSLKTFTSQMYRQGQAARPVQEPPEQTSQTQPAHFLHAAQPQPLPTSVEDLRFYNAEGRAGGAAFGVGAVFGNRQHTGQATAPGHRSIGTGNLNSAPLGQDQGWNTGTQAAGLEQQQPVPSRISIAGPVMSDMHIIKQEHVTTDMIHRIQEGRRSWLDYQRRADGLMLSSVQDHVPGGGGVQYTDIVEDVADALLEELLLEQAQDLESICESLGEKLYEQEFS